MNNKGAFGSVRWLVTAAAVALVLPSGGVGRAESLMEIMEAAQVNDPEFRAAGFQNRADAENTRQAWARFLPQLRGSVVYNFTRQNILSSDNSVYDIGRNAYPDYGYEVRLEQSLFDFQNWANLRAARALKRQSNAQFESVKQDLLLRVVERYFAVLAAQEAESAAQSETRALKGHLDLVSSKYARGAVRYAELLDARARHQLAVAKQVEAAAAIRDAQVSLKEITGKLPGPLEGLSDKMEAEPLAPAEPEYWLSLATRSNPRALSANEAAARGKHLVDVEKASAYPTVGLQFYHDRRKTEGSLFGGGSDIRQYGGRVRLDVPIYAGGMVKSRVREAQNLVRKADAEADRTLRSVERETLQAMDAITSASARVTALRASLAAQEKAVSQLAAAYRAGVSSSVDYLDAERDLFRARTELLRARYDYALGTIRLRHAVGMLGIEDLAELELHMTPSSAAA